MGRAVNSSAKSIGRILVSRELPRSLTEHLVCWGVLALVGVAASVVLVRACAGDVYHVDESGWVGAGFHYADLFLNGDFTPEHWETNELRNFGDVNPHLGKLLLGVPLELYARAIGAKRFHGFYLARYSFAENAARGNLPRWDMVLLARLAAALFGVGCVLLVFALGWRCGNLLTGALAAALLLGNATAGILLTRALTDAHFNFFLLAAFLALAEAARGSKDRTAWGWWAMAGLAAGLAANVKITAIVLGGAAALVMAASGGLLGRRPPRRSLAHLALFGAAMMLLVYALNPFLWPNLSRLDTAELRTETARVLSREDPGTEPGPEPSQRFWEDIAAQRLQRDAIREAWPQLYNLLRPLELPAMFLRWRTIVDFQAKQNWANWRGPRLPAMTRALFHEHASFRFEWVLLLAGLGFAGKWAIAARARKQTDPRVAPALFFLVHAAFLVLLVKLNWWRYYLPALLAGRVVIAQAIFALTASALMRLSGGDNTGRQGT